MRRVRGLPPVSTRWLLRATAALVPAAVVPAAVVAARLVRRVEVTGASMQPALNPGDRLLAVRWPRTRPGDLVVVDDPRQPGRLLVKRVATTSRAGIVVLGDNPEASTDSRAFGPVSRVMGRVVYRYAPADRAGRLGCGRGG